MPPDDHALVRCFAPTTLGAVIDQKRHGPAGHDLDAKPGQLAVPDDARFFTGNDPVQGTLGNFNFLIRGFGLLGQCFERTINTARAQPSAPNWCAKA